ncbi:MAG: signal peptide peptidase SppA [Rhodospirillales bacterium]|nr:signal peptide peptidase SppA [Rhodospirillales bacterium]
MSATDPDILIDRRRLKRQLSLWRLAAVLTVLGAIAVGVDQTGYFGPGAHVAQLSLDGLIVDDPARLRAVADLAADNAVKAVVLRIDSPGGTVVGSEALYREIRALAQTKPVVATMGQVAASGGYMVALGADHIVAYEGTITGSIGVIMQTTDVTGLLTKLGITAEAIKSAPLKAAPSPLEPLTDEARAATRSLVADMFDLFVGMVAERRKLAREDALKLADGRVYTGRQALANGLIDALGGDRAARAWLESRGIERNLPLIEVTIRREDDFWRGMLSATLRMLTGKTYLSERLTLDGLVAVWHPDLRVR